MLGLKNFIIFGCIFRKEEASEINHLSCYFRRLKKLKLSHVQNEMIKIRRKISKILKQKIKRENKKTKS